MKKPKTHTIKLLEHITVAIGFSFFLLVHNSCTMMALKLSGNLKNPKLQDAESIKKYADKFNDPYDYLWMPDSKLHFDQILKRYPGMPEVLIYDKNYSVLKNAHGEACQKLLISFFIDSLKHEYKKINDSSYAFLQEKTKEVAKNKPPQDYDYIIVYGWVKFTPKITKDVFERLSAIKKTGQYKICFVSLNKDWQKELDRKAPKLSGKVKGHSALERTD